MTLLKQNTDLIKEQSNLIKEQSDINLYHTEMVMVTIFKICINKLFFFKTIYGNK